MPFRTVLQHAEDLIAVAEVEVLGLEVEGVQVDERTASLYRRALHLRQKF